MNHKNRLIVKKILLVLVCLIFLYSAIAKFIGNDSIQQMLTSLSMQQYIVRLGIIELIIVGSLLWRPLRSLGVLVGSAYLGGAIFSLIATGNNPLTAGITLILLWAMYKLEWWGYWDHGNKCACGWCTVDTTEKCTCAVPDCTCDKGHCTC